MRPRFAILVALLLLPMGSGLALGQWPGYGGMTAAPAGHMNATQLHATQQPAIANGYPATSASSFSFTPGQSFFQQMQQANRPAANPGPEPVYWQQDVFVIPYQWSARNDAANATAVILYLSTDRGTNWAEVTRGKPEIQSFRYQAARDGEYWFAVRTIDQRGQMWPAGALEAELSVVVDTQIPKVTQLSGTLDSSGRLQVVCEATDANLDPASFELAVRSTMPATQNGQGFGLQAAPEEWIRLPVTTSAAATPGVTRATATWQAPAGVKEVSLRLSVEDLAKNPAWASQKVFASPTPAAPTAAPMAAPPASAFGLAQQTGPRDPFLAAPALELPSAGQWQSGPEPPAVATAPESTGIPWPTDATAATPFRASDPEAWASRPTPAPIRHARPSFDRSLDRSPYHQASASRGTRRRQASSTVVTSPHNDSFASDAPDDNLLFVNEERFALDYDLESTGNWGVSKVEVWGTADGGQTWRVFAQDSDNRSPVNITTPGEGRYGFRILVQGVGSLPVEPPAPGDRPEIQVEVDLQPPAAQFVSAGQGSGYLGDHLVIAWQAGDDYLLPRPVTLRYSDRPTGPWAVIASDLETGAAGSPGRYDWRLQRHLPSQVYLRMEVRDRAGNVTTVDTSQPVSIDFSQPAARLRAARPLGN
ncbi:MAG: hypothetical protein AAGF31_01585 [Planctomycetota bacterium]